MKILKSEPLSRHTSFRIGGPALIYAIPGNRKELVSLLRFLHKEGMEYKILGNGTNILVSDSGVDCVVVEVSNSFNGMSLIADESGERIWAEAGISLSLLSSRVRDLGLAGMEALSGIPGTLGGAIVMNAGAYGTEIKDILEGCVIMTREGVLKEVPAKYFQLSYRHSNIEEKGFVIISAILHLKKGKKEDIQDKMNEYQKQRLDKQPLDLASAGSTFRRPEGAFAGKLIEEARLKGYKCGQAQVSEKHCGFIINNGGASANDVWQLIKHVRDKVFLSSGFKLEPEVKTWGKF